MGRLATLILITVIAVITLSAQEEQSTIRVIFLPGELDVPPLVASYQEPRVGLRKEVATSKLKVDIGASLDMLEYRNSTHRLRLGIEFFTYALSTNSEGLRLQIDAVDGYFGGHISYSAEYDNQPRFILRLRLLHLSAHFLDGHFNNATQTWKDNRAPIPFTRDFGELIGMYEHEGRVVSTRLYGGFSYATLVRPTIIKRLEFLGGIELHSASIVPSLFGRPFSVYLADHFMARGIPSYVGTNNLECGVKFGRWTSTGLKIYISYYNGLDIFSQYFDVRRESVGVGFAFDFW